MGLQLTHTHILLPDGKAVAINKVYGKGQGPSAADLTFLGEVSTNFGPTTDPNAFGFGKAITIMGEVARKTLELKTDNNDGTSTDKGIPDSVAYQSKVYPIATIGPMISGDIEVLPPLDYEVIGFKQIALSKVEQRKQMLRIMIRKQLLKVADEDAQNYKGYKANGELSTTAIVESSGATIDAVVKEIETKYVVGHQLDEAELYKKDAIIKITQAIEEKFEEKGITNDEHHPTIIDGIAATEIVCITTSKVINAIANSDRNLYQTLNLPGGISLKVASVNGIKFIPEKLVKNIAGGKGRMLFVVAKHLVFMTDTVKRQVYKGVIETGTTRSLVVRNSDGTTSNKNLQPRHATITYGESLYVGKKLNGIAVVVRVK